LWRKEHFLRYKKNLIALIAVLSLVVGGAWALASANFMLTEAHPPVRIHKYATKDYQFGYTPAQIKKAYGIDQSDLTGLGQKIAIVVAYGSSTLEDDLAVFNNQFQLPPANLNIAYPQGKPTKKDTAFAIETAIDVEWAHALAPDAEILLVVAKSATLENLLGAVDYAKNQGAGIVSMSWGADEFAGENYYDSVFSNPGTTFFASSGDYGTILWPSSSPNVVSVGGTTLLLDADGNLTGTETAWPGSGGGISPFLGEPAYQAEFGISANGRGVPDVSFNADPNTGVAIYSSTNIRGSKGWFVVGGTSFGAPAWSAVMALVNQNRSTPVTDGHDALYQIAATAYGACYRDITEGNNGQFSAGTGYDFVTGLGSPLVNQIVPKLTDE